MRQLSRPPFVLLTSAWALGVVGAPVAGAWAAPAPAPAESPPLTPALGAAHGQPAGGAGTGGRAGTVLGRTVPGSSLPPPNPPTLSPLPPLPPLPPARPIDAILADVVSAVGGAAALGRHRSMHTKMEITFKGLGITGTAEHYAAVGDKALTITEIPNLASTREGSDGVHFWSDDPINGLRLLDGAEAEQTRTEVAWNAELRMKELFQKIEVKNQRNDDGSILECLVLTPQIGPGTTNCFDRKTHLMAIQKGMRSGPQGDMPFTARLSDWRTVGDVKISYATDMQVGPLAFIGRVTSVELDVPVDPTLFEIPKTAKTGKSGKSGPERPDDAATESGDRKGTGGAGKKGRASKPQAPAPASPAVDKR